MKKTLTVLCLMIALAGAGQTTRWQTFSPNTAISKYDTIPIIYLYCNTKGTSIAYWDFGYEVREETGLIPVTSRENNMLYDWVMSYKHIGYLDRQKNPIRKSIVIFMTKTIEK